MPVLLAPTRVTAGMVRMGLRAFARHLDDWTLRAFNSYVRPGAELS